MNAVNQKLTILARLMMVLTLSLVVSCGRVALKGGTRTVGNALTQEQPAVAMDGAMTTVSLALNALEAPQVRLPKVEIFNGSLYLRLECSGLRAHKETCESGGESDPDLALRDLSLSFVSINQSAPLLSEIDYDRMKALDFGSAHEFRTVSDGGVEVGPLKAPLQGDSERLGVVVRRQMEKDGEQLQSFKVFFLK